jgi:PAS domain-containing protein
MGDAVTPKKQFTVAASRDNTDPGCAEERLRNSEEKYRRLAENMSGRYEWGRPLKGGSNEKIPPPSENDNSFRLALAFRNRFANSRFPLSVPVTHRLRLFHR